MNAPPVLLTTVGLEFKDVFDFSTLAKSWRSPFFSDLSRQSACDFGSFRPGYPATAGKGKFITPPVNHNISGQKCNLENEADSIVNIDDTVSVTKNSIDHDEKLLGYANTPSLPARILHSPRYPPLPTCMGFFDTKMDQEIYLVPPMLPPRSGLSDVKNDHDLLVSPPSLPPRAQSLKQTKCSSNFDLKDIYGDYFLQ